MHYCGTRHREFHTVRTLRVLIGFDAGVWHIGRYWVRLGVGGRVADGRWIEVGHDTGGWGKEAEGKTG